MLCLAFSMFHPTYLLKLRKTRSPFLFHYLWLIEIGVAFLFSRANPALTQEECWVL